MLGIIQKELLKRKYNRWFKNHQFSLILEDLKEALAKYPKDVHFQIYQLMALIETQQYQKAFEIVKKAIEIHSENQVILNLHAECCHRLGKTDQALESLKKVLDQTPDNLHSSYLMGQIYVAKGDLDQACKYFEPILQYDPKLLNTRLLAVAERSIFELNQKQKI